MSGNFSVADGVLSVAGEMPEVAAVECSWKESWPARRRRTRPKTQMWTGAAYRKPVGQSPPTVQKKRNWRRNPVRLST